MLLELQLYFFNSTKLNEMMMMMMMMMNCFVVWLTNERHLALFLAGTIVRNTHHLQSLTLCEQELNLPRTIMLQKLQPSECRVQTLLNENV